MMSSSASRWSSKHHVASGNLSAPRSAEIHQLSPEQAQETRDLFSLLDKDGDGIITNTDLSSMLNSLGQDSSSGSLKEMFSFMPTPLDFPAYLTYITSLKTQVSSREELSGAFTAFDERDSGFITYDDLKQDLVTTGPHRMTEEQVEIALRPFVEKTGRNRGKVSYTKFLDAMMGEQNLQRNKNDHMTT